MPYKRNYNHVVYLIENKLNNKKYIGYSSFVEKRWYMEKYQAFHIDSKDYNSKLSRAFRKYNVENFDFIVLEDFEDQKEALEREVFYIKFFNTIKEGYNICPGGEKTRLGAILSEETKMKISLANKGRPSKFKGIPNGRIPHNKGKKILIKLNEINIKQIKLLYETNLFSQTELGCLFNLNRSSIIKALKF